MRVQAHGKYHGGEVISMRVHAVPLRTIKRLLATGKTQRARALLARLDPHTGAEALEALSPEDAAELLAALDPDLAADFLAVMDDEPRAHVLEHLEPAAVADVIEEMPSDEGADVLQDMPRAEAEEVLAQVDQVTRSELEELTEYAEDTAGGIMAKEFAALPQDLSASEALEVLRREFQDVEQLNVLFALDEEGRLVGSLSLRDLVFAEPDTPLRELVERHRHWVEEHQDQEEVVHYMLRHNLDAVPVVDEAHRVVGQITLDDAAEVMDEEAAEDLAGMVGMAENETVFGPLSASMRRRLPWLLVNAPLALLAATILSLYEDTISKAAVLVIFLPVIGGMAGNAAGQTLAVFIRGLAVGEVSVADTWRAVARQLLLALCLGVPLGMIVGAIAWWWRGSLVLGAVVAAALLLNCLTALLLGSLLPLLLERLNLDPALGSNMVATSITDATGYLYVLGLGTLVIRMGWLK